MLALRIDSTSVNGGRGGPPGGGYQRGGGRAMMGPPGGPPPPMGGRWGRVEDEKPVDRFLSPSVPPSIPLSLSRARALSLAVGSRGKREPRQPACMLASFETVRARCHRDTDTGTDADTKTQTRARCGCVLSRTKASAASILWRTGLSASLSSLHPSETTHVC